MEKFNPLQSVGEIVVKFPKAGDIFKEYRIDYCCGGNKTLQSVAKEERVNEVELLD